MKIKTPQVRQVRIPEPLAGTIDAARQTSGYLSSFPVFVQGLLRKGLQVELKDQEAIRRMRGGK